MKRGIATIVVLLAGTALSVRADYFVIKINLAATKDKEEPQAGGNQIAGGQFGGPPGDAGGAGMMMARMRGQQGGASPGPGGARGFGGGASPGPRGGQPGGPGGGGGDGGGATMAGATGTPDGGDSGGKGMRGMPGGGRGMPGMSGGISASMSTIGGEDDEPESFPLNVGAIVEVRADTIKGTSYDGVYTHTIINHKFGKTTLVLPTGGDEVEIRWIKKQPTLNQRFDAKLKAIGESDPNRVARMLALAETGLEYGLYDRVAKLMDDIVAAEPKQPIAVLYAKLKADMDRKITRSDAAMAWESKLSGYKVAASNHYAIIHDVAAEKVVQSFLGHLENQYRAFYTWFALKGKALPVPDRRLVAILVNSPEAFRSQHKEIFDEMPMLSDGFFAQRDNIAVLSSTRLDEPYEGLMRLYPHVLDRGKWTEEALLQNKGYRVQLPPNEWAYAATLALVKKSMEEDGQIATVSHEGTRQLMVATGLLPRSTQAPEWIDFGMASFFESAKGAYWRGVAGKNSPYLVNFKLWTDNKTLEKNPAQALKSVVTDQYFTRVKDAKNKEGALTKARTMTWALTYFLAEKKLDGLMGYYAELANQPRDLALDEDVKLACFARAFGLVSPNKPNDVDEHKLSLLANEWYSFVKSTGLEYSDTLRFLREEIQAKKDAETRAQQGAASGNAQPGFGGPGQFGPPGGNPRGGLTPVGPGGPGGGRGDGK